jgi:collagenase-like PrtC family protease
MGLLNGRPTEVANFRSSEEIQKAIDECRKYSIKFHITFNLLPYL